MSARVSLTIEVDFLDLAPALLAAGMMEPAGDGRYESTERAERLGLMVSTHGRDEARIEFSRLLLHEAAEIVTALDLARANGAIRS